MSHLRVLTSPSISTATPAELKYNPFPDAVPSRIACAGPKMYILYMTSPVDRSISEARRDLAAVIDEARATREPVFLSRHGHRVAAIISADELERLRDLAEDMADILDAEAARQEMRATGAAPVPWDQVKADLGLV